MLAILLNSSLRYSPFVPTVPASKTDRKYSFNTRRALTSHATTQVTEDPQSDQSDLSVHREKVVARAVKLDRVTLSSDQTKGQACPAVVPEQPRYINKAIRQPNRHTRSAGGF